MQWGAPLPVVQVGIESALQQLARHVGYVVQITFTFGEHLRHRKPALQEYSEHRFVRVGGFSLVEAAPAATYDYGVGCSQELAVFI